MSSPSTSSADEDDGWESFDETNQDDYYKKLEIFLSKIDEIPFTKIKVKKKVAASKEQLAKVKTDASFSRLLKVMQPCYDQLIKITPNSITDLNVVLKLIELQRVIDKLLNKTELKNKVLAETKNTASIADVQSKPIEKSSLKEIDTVDIEPKNLTNETIENIVNEDQLNKHQKVGCPFCFMPFHSKKELFLHLDKNCLYQKSHCESENKGLKCFQLITDGFKCNVCQVVLLNYGAKEEHFKSDLHFQKSRLKNQSYLTHVLYCSLCQNIMADSEPQVLSHLESKIHVNLVRNKRRLLLEASVAFMLHTEEKARCLICSTNLKSHCIEKHTESSNHVKLLKKRKISLVWCSVCDEKFNLKQLKEHEGLKSHEINSHTSFSCLFCDEQCNGIACLEEHSKNKCKSLKALRFSETSASKPSLQVEVCENTLVKPSPFRFVTYRIRAAAKTLDTLHEGDSVIGAKRRTEGTNQNKPVNSSTDFLISVDFGTSIETLKCLPPELRDFIHFINTGLAEFEEKLIDLSNESLNSEFCNTSRKIYQLLSPSCTDVMEIGSKKFKVSYPSSSIDLVCLIRNQENSLGHLWAALSNITQFKDLRIVSDVDFPHIACYLYEGVAKTSVRVTLSSPLLLQEAAFLTDWILHCPESRSFMLIVKWWNQSLELLPSFLITILAAAYMMMDQGPEAEDEKRKSVFQLLVGFFEFYSKFNFPTNRLELSSKGCRILPWISESDSFISVSSFGVSVGRQTTRSQLDKFKSFSGLTFNNLR